MIWFSAFFHGLIDKNLLLRGLRIRKGVLYVKEILSTQNLLPGGLGWFEGAVDVPEEQQAGCHDQGQGDRLLDEDHEGVPAAHQGLPEGDLHARADDRSKVLWFTEKVPIMQTSRMIPSFKCVRLLHHVRGEKRRTN